LQVRQPFPAFSREGIAGFGFVAGAATPVGNLPKGAACAVAPFYAMILA